MITGGQDRTGVKTSFLGTAVVVGGQGTQKAAGDQSSDGVSSNFKATDFTVTIDSSKHIEIENNCVSGKQI